MHKSCGLSDYFLLEIELILILLKKRDSPITYQNFYVNKVFQHLSSHKFKTPIIYPGSNNQYEGSWFDRGTIYSILNECMDDFYTS